ncbi:hypothetical protein EF912_05590 [Streptomyces sp. WAC07061]|uniref:hypothetical protein n=1 Tax=Streptomyces sp. WAC07061 TaxID=2487410 RepID=UPI000F78FE5E|nr:hypothetical protein [Streptomyces sp. WAC07061]RSS62178.1 hypothetical protein EF912_05590 [Streptomyces sp. WAC07061]
MHRRSRWEPYHRAGRTAAATAAAALIGVLTGCSDLPGEEEVRYAGDYGGHEPLAVVGYPSTGTLRTAQEVVWRTADGNTAELAALAAPGTARGVPAATARNWISAFGEGARGKVTAEFYDEGSKRQSVVLYFHATGQIKQIDVRTGMGGEDRDWYVYMDEPQPAAATAVPSWIPKTPGALGSRSVP